MELTLEINRKKDHRKKIVSWWIRPIKTSYNWRSNKDREEIDELQEDAEVQEIIEEILQEGIWEISVTWVDTHNRIFITQVTKAKRKH